MSQAPLARTEDLVVQSVGDETIIVDSRTDQAHALPAPVAQIWELCDGNRSVNAIMEALNVEPAFVMQVLEELEACDLLQVAEPAGLVNRRVMIGRTAGLAVAGALIATIAVPPTLAMASSGLGSATASTSQAGTKPLVVFNNNNTTAVTPDFLSVGNSLVVDSAGNYEASGTPPPAGGDNWQISYSSYAITILFTAATGTALTGSYTYTDLGNSSNNASDDSVQSGGQAVLLTYTTNDSITLTLGF